MIQKVFVKTEQVYSEPLLYILSLFAQNRSIHLRFVDEKINATWIFDHTDSLSIPVNICFFQKLIAEKKYNHSFYFENEPMVLFPDQKPDYLGTAFYMVNAFQEHQGENDQPVLDQYGRFPYGQSYQFKFGCIQGNLVQKCFDAFHVLHPGWPESKNSDQTSRVFLSHDIDKIHGSLLEDGFWAAKKGRLDVIMTLLMNEILRKPHWNNISKIMNIHSEHDLKSTFFWIATQEISSNQVKNADYPKNELQDFSKLTESNGIHKSACTYTFRQELDLLPFKTEINRYHFLKFTLPQAWKELEEADLKLDASLGFAENYGFRNNYALPFCPYDLENKRAHHFVEVPLNVMDTTLHRYMKIPVKETASRIIDFIEKYKTNAIISILWHNNYFTDYKYAGYLQEYKKVLLYLNETGIKSVTPDEIIKEYIHE